jgi:hypothetical protein
MSAPCPRQSCCDPDALAPYDGSAIVTHDITNVGCGPEPNVTIDPPDGSLIQLPTFVVLTADRSDAQIFYTVDGSIPTPASTPYTAPFSFTDNNFPVQAVAIVSGCPTGPVAFARYKVGPNFIEFNYSCDTNDLVGQWSQFTGNGKADYHWKLRLSITAPIDLKRIELYQTDVHGHWNTGQAWATAEYINPVGFPPNFHVFPLGVFDDNNSPNLAYSTAPELKVAYTNDFNAALAAGVYLWTLVGQPVVTLPACSGGISPAYFKILLFFGDGSILTSLISACCGDPPCPTPQVSISSTPDASLCLHAGDSVTLHVSAGQTTDGWTVSDCNGPILFVGSDGTADVLVTPVEGCCYTVTAHNTAHGCDKTATAQLCFSTIPASCPGDLTPAKLGIVNWNPNSFFGPGTCAFGYRQGECVTLPQWDGSFAAGSALAM